LIKSSSLYSNDPEGGQPHCESDEDDCIHGEVCSHNTHSKELILSFKTIYMNTYDIIIINLNGSMNNFVFKHQNFHLWEK
jgi:hypothetical protein